MKMSFFLKVIAVFMLLVMSGNGEAGNLVSPDLVDGAAWADGWSTRTTLQKLFKAYDPALSDQEMRSYMDILTTAPDITQKWARTTLQGEDVTSLTLRGMIAKAVLKPFHVQDVVVGNEKSRWILAIYNSYSQEKPIEPPEKGSPDAHDAQIFLRPFSEAELDAVEARIRRILINKTPGTSFTAQEQFGAFRLISGYLDQRADTKLVDDFWTSGTGRGSKMEMLTILVGVRNEKLVDQSIRLASQIFSPDAPFRPTMKNPSPGSFWDVMLRATAISTLSDHAEEATARKFIFETLDKNPMMFLPYEDTILRRVFRPDFYPNSGDEEAILRELKNHLTTDYHTIRS